MNNKSSVMVLKWAEYDLPVTAVGCFHKPRRYSLNKIQINFFLEYADNKKMKRQCSVVLEKSNTHPK